MSCETMETNRSVWIDQFDQMYVILPMTMCSECWIWRSQARFSYFFLTPTMYNEMRIEYNNLSHLIEWLFFFHRSLNDETKSSWWRLLFCLTSLLPHLPFERENAEHVFVELVSLLRVLQLLAVIRIFIDSLIFTKVDFNRTTKSTVWIHRRIETLLTMN